MTKIEVVKLSILCILRTAIISSKYRKNALLMTCIITNNLLYVSAIIKPSSGRTLSPAQNYC